MKIRIISFRRSTVKEIALLESSYAKRLSKIAPIELIDLKPMSGKLSSTQKSFEADAQHILKYVESDEPTVVLDAGGRAITSEEFAKLFFEYEQKGVRRVTFLIGSAEGFNSSVKARANFLLNISSLTLPHQLVRLILIEAIYRSFDLLRGGAYHK